MKTCSLFLLGLFAFQAAADLTIFDTRRTLRMADSDPVYHDYYINGGNEAGLQTGMVITVRRKLPLYDNYANHSAGDLQLKVARVKIIHVQKGLAVARLQSEFTRENAPLLEDPFIMVGDNLDISTATHDGKKESANSEPAPAEPTAKTESTGKPIAQITVNSVDLSSTAPVPNPSGEVSAPTLQ